MKLLMCVSAHVCATIQLSLWSTTLATTEFAFYSIQASGTEVAIWITCPATTDPTFYSGSLPQIQRLQTVVPFPPLQSPYSGAYLSQILIFPSGAYFF